MKLPKLIALCGNPKSGKSEVQSILTRRFDVVAVDDGLPLRDFLVRHMGRHSDDVNTQGGKMSHFDVLGRDWQVRQALGQLGNALETLFGAHVMPWMAVERHMRVLPDRPASFGSVRRDQGRFYKERGGVVIKVENPMARPTGNEFDTFDESLVDYVIHNHFPHPDLTVAESATFLDGQVVGLMHRIAAERRLEA